MYVQDELGESPADFLAALGGKLVETSTDTALAQILGEHMLQAAPASDAVAKAKAAIVKLAGDRANPAVEDSANG